MRDVEALQAQHALAAPRQVVDGGAAHAADADDDGVVATGVGALTGRWAGSGGERIDEGVRAGVRQPRGRGGGDEFGTLLVLSVAERMRASRVEERRRGDHGRDGATVISTTSCCLARRGWCLR